MDSDLLSEDGLIQKHKRERKELQAQIQVLKKSICKGDKKKKKEVTEEIAKREADLDKRHDEEMASLKLSNMSLDPGLGVTETISTISDDTDDNVADSNSQSQKMSKAKRRREKKAKEEQERNKRIIEEEAENQFGKRNVEIQAIENILLKRDLMIYEIPSDGHCLYNAIAHQLKIKDQTPMALEELRSKTANYLRQNMNDYLPFLTNPDTGDTLSTEEFEQYCINVHETPSWGGDVELQVLSRVLQCPIEVVQASSAPYIIGDEFEKEKKLMLTYHRYMYGLGEHYNSVTKYVKRDE